MTIAEMQQEILQLKERLDVGILAHSYQSHAVLEVADYVGDSYQLSLRAADAPQKTVLMCGVRFMAETVKILAPEKRVILASPEAGCPMAEQISPEAVLSWRERHPEGAVVCYVNTTARLKAVCDVCVTSSSAETIVPKLPQKEILFVPDQNLGGYIAALCPDKRFTLMDGGCPYHGAITPGMAAAARAAHPKAQLLVHPECPPAVSAMADFVGSTAAIMAEAKRSEAKEFIIGTENSIAEHLSFECPDKRFYPLSASLVCSDMKLTTLPDVLAALQGKGGEEILLDEAVRQGALRSIREMIRLG